MNRITKEELLERAKGLSEAPDVIDVQNKEPMLYLWQVEALLESIETY